MSKHVWCDVFSKNFWIRETRRFVRATVEAIKLRTRARGQGTQLENRVNSQNLALRTWNQIISALVNQPELNLNLARSVEEGQPEHKKKSNIDEFCRFHLFVMLTTLQGDRDEKNNKHGDS